jgi:hypothetical protein
MSYRDKEEVVHWCLFVPRFRAPLPVPNGGGGFFLTPQQVVVHGKCTGFSCYQSPLLLPMEELLEDFC